MTYNSRPMYGIKESFYGPAAYREAEYQQSTKPQPAQSLAVGDSKTKPTIEGFEKTIYPQPGTKQELMGAGVVAYAQAFETWAEDANASEPEPTPQYETVTFTGTGTEEDPYVPAFAENTYYKKEGDKYVLLSSKPNDWGTGTYYKVKEAV